VRPIPELYPYTRLRTVRGTGHHLFLTHTCLCLDLFREFLNEGNRKEGARAPLQIGEAEPNSDR
jgi:hypothetical protein